MARVMVFNATFNNISGISWRSILFVEEIGVPGENHRHAANYWQIYHIMLYRVHLAILYLGLVVVVLGQTLRKL